MSTSIGRAERKRFSFFASLDYWLLIPVLFICILGIYVLDIVLQLNFPRAYPRNVIVQIVAIGLGLIVMFVITIIERSLFRLLGWMIYAVGLIMQLMLPIFGSAEIAAQTGSNAWLVLPGLGTFQPSELSKSGLCVVLAFLLEDIKLKRFNYWQGFLLFGLITGPHLFMIMIYQKDFGTSMVVVFMLACIIFVWGVKLRYVFLLLSAGVISIPFIWNNFFRPYQQQRILAFLYPNYDPTASYNVNQAKLAIASGGLLGNKSGEYVSVPVQESDFIFSAVGEHMGLIGTSLLIILAFVFLFRCAWLAMRMERPAYQYIVTGITAVYAFHYIENIGMNLGLMPVTGIPLPFVSQGGSAMLVNFLSLGLIMNLSLHRNMDIRT